MSDLSSMSKDDKKILAGMYTRFLPESKVSYLFSILTSLQSGEQLGNTTMGGYFVNTYPAIFNEHSDYLDEFRLSEDTDELMAVVVIIASRYLIKVMH